MRTLLKTGIILSGLLSFNSCTTQMYVSNAVNTPLLKEKGEVQVSATQNDLQTAFGVGNNFGIMANGFYKSYKGENSYRHSGVLGELGLGYFKPVGLGFVFETYAGAGLGSVYKQQQFTGENNTSYTGSFVADAAKYFLQPNFGFRSGFFDASISSRFSAVKYRSFDAVNYPQEELREDYLDNNNLTGPTFLFAEPALTARVGYRFVKLQAQYGLTVNLTGHNIRHASNFASLGVMIDIARWYNN